MLSRRSLVLAFALLVPACTMAPPEDADEAGTAAGAVTTGHGRDVRCSTTVDGVQRSLRLALGAVGSGGRARMVDPSLRERPLGVATVRDGDVVRVQLTEASGAALTTLRLPATLWNDPSRAATTDGTPMFREPWFDAEVVGTVGPSWTTPRCELAWVPSAPGFSSDLVVDGADAERLFVAMNAPIQGSRGDARPGERPLGTKMIEGPGLWRLECEHRAPDDVPFPVPLDDARPFTCTMRMATHVAARTETLTTYRMTLTEREKAGRLFVAFESLSLGDRVGFEVRGLVASTRAGRAPVAGSRLRVACTDEGDLRTTCELELVTATD